MNWEQSKNTLMRSKGRSALLMTLIMLVCAFCSIGTSIFYNSEQLLKQANEEFKTIAMVEYTAGNYPDEEQKGIETLDKLKEINQEGLKNHPLTKKYCTQYNLFGYSERATTPLDDEVPYKGNEIILLHISSYEEGVGYRGIVLKTLFGKQTKVERSVYIPNQIEVETEDGEIWCYDATDLTVDEVKESHPNGKITITEDDRFQVDHDYITIGEVRANFSHLKYETAFDTGLSEENELDRNIKDFPVIDVTGHREDYETLPELKGWMDLIDFFQVCNQSFHVTAVDDIMIQQQFFLGVAELKDGRLFTEEEAKEGKRVCVMCKAYADKLGVNVGDKIPINLFYSDDQTNCYEGYNPVDGFKETGEYEVVGIYDLPGENGSYRVYIPKESLENPPKEQLNYSLANIVIENGKGIEFEEDIEQYLVDNTRVLVFDQGYTQTISPIKAMRSNSIFIMILTGIASLIIIVLFAELHITKQKETVSVMTALGSGKKHIKTYLSLETCCMAGGGSILGLIVGCLLSQYVSDYIYQNAQNLYAKDLRFSVLNVGVMNNFQGKITRSIPLSIMVCVVIFALVYVICDVYANRLIAKTYSFGGVSEKKKKQMKAKTYNVKVKELHLKKKEIIVTKASFRKRRRLFFLIEHSNHSIQRNWNVSFIMLLISLVSAVFVCLFSHLIDSYYLSKEEAYETIPVTAYYTTIYGRYISQEKVEEKAAEVLDNYEYLEERCSNTELYYQYLGEWKTGLSDKEEEKQFDEYNKIQEELLPCFGTRLEIRGKIREIREKPHLVYTTNIAMSKEFLGQRNPEVVMGVGNENIFENTYKDEIDLSSEENINGNKVYREYSSKEALLKDNNLKVLVSEQFLEENQLKIGDSIAFSRIDIWELGGQDSFEWFDSYVTVGEIIGSYQSSLKQDSIFVPFRKGYPEQFCSYLLNHTKDLSLLRDQLEYIGMRGIGYVGGIRTSVIINDGKLIQTIDNIDNTITFLTMLRYILFGIIIVIGFVAAYLSMRTRKQEVAIIRSMGTGQIRTFFLFFWEYAVITLLGCVLGLATALYYIGNYELDKVLMVAGLYVFYMLGSGLCILKMNRTNILSTLSTPE